MDSAQAPPVALRGVRRGHARKPGVGPAFHHAQDRQGAGASGLQLHRAQLARSGCSAPALPLAFRDRSQAHQSGGFRVGRRLLHQPYAAGGVGPVLAGSRAGVNWFLANMPEKKIIAVKTKKTKRRMTPPEPSKTAK